MQMSELLMGDKAMWFLHMKLLIISLKKCTIFDRQENNLILNLISVKNRLKQNSRNSSSIFSFFLVQPSDRHVQTK